MTIVTKGKIVRSDQAVWDGVEPRVTRRDSTGGTIQSLPVNDFVDVLQAYGNGLSYTRNTIEQATVKIGSSKNRTLLFTPGTWEIEDDLTIGSNFTSYIPAGVVFNVASGKTLTFNGPVIREGDSWTSGSGTVTTNADSSSALDFLNTGTGAEARTLRAKLDEVISVKDFGAVGDATTDDSAAIQACVTAAAGRRIFFPPGRYKITQAITSSDPVYVYGVGNGQGPDQNVHPSSGISEILIASSTAYAFEITSFYSSIFRDLKFDVPSANQPQTSGGGLKIDGNVSTGHVSGIFENLLFENVFDGIHIIRPDRPRITNCWFGWWLRNGIRLVTTSGVESSGGYIHKNRFRNTGGALEAAVQASVYSEVGYTHVVDNNFSGGSVAVDFDIDGNDAGNILLELNNAENQGKVGFRIGTKGNNEASMIRIHNNEFSNVSFATAMTAHIQITEDTTIPKWIADIDITGNVLRSSLPTGAKYIWIGAGETIRVSNNQIEELGANTPIGIQITGVTINTGYTRPIDVFDNQITGSNITRYTFNSTTLTTLRDITHGIAVASLPANTADGSIVYATDGTVGSNPLTASGNGALAMRANGAWVGLGKAAATGTYTPTNVIADRSYDADATTTGELADVLGTLISDLQDRGVLG